MSKIYIDVGAYQADTLDCKKLFNFDADYTIAFEPNPLFAELLQDKVDEFHPAAAWTEDGEMDFSVDFSDTPLGSTLMKSKKTWKTGKHIKVKTIDFSKFVDNLDADKLLVKYDAEGAEFPVLKKMIADGTIKKIDSLYVEFHHNKVPEYTTTYKNQLVRKLQRYTDVHEWLD